MTYSMPLRWLLVSLLPALAAGVVFAEEPRGGTAANSNRDFWTIHAIAGHPALSADVFGGGLDGRYSCGNTTTRATPHRVRYPFSVPDHSGLVSLSVWGFKGQTSPDIELRVRVSCMDQEVLPNTATLGSTTLSGTLVNFFATVETADLMLASDACHYWVEAAFELADQPCNDVINVIGNIRLTRLRLETRVRDRIFRGSFHQVLETF